MSMKPFTRIDGLPVAIGIARDYLNMAAAFGAQFPGVDLQVSSGVRTYAEQEAIFRARYTLTPNGRRVYDSRWWNGQLWHRISPVGTVAAPGTSNHETGRSLDLRDTGADAGVAASFHSARNVWLSQNCRRWGFTHTGRNFGEPWHFEQLRVADPWLGLPKPHHIGPSDPGQPLDGAPDGAGGGTVATPTPNPNNIQEDDMRLYHIKGTSRHYAIAPEYIADIEDTKTVGQLETDLGIAEVPISEWAFKQLRLGFGIPDKALDKHGRVWNVDKEKYQHGGVWSTAQEARRFAWLAQKG